MSGMTMAFPIHENWVWNELKPGAEIQGELVVDNKAMPDPFWLENVTIISAPIPTLRPRLRTIGSGKRCPIFAHGSDESGIGKGFSW